MLSAGKKESKKKKRGFGDQLEKNKKTLPPLHSSPPAHALPPGTGQVWLCGWFVGLADRFASVHHHWLACAFTGRHGRLGHRLSDVVKRWLSVHGDWRETNREIRRKLLAIICPLSLIELRSVPEYYLVCYVQLKYSLKKKNKETTLKSAIS